MTPAEWGHVGVSGVLSAVVAAIGAYFVKRAERVKPEALSVPQVETITKGLGELIDDLQQERRDNRHVIRNLRMELDGLYEKLSRAEAANARLGRELERLAALARQYQETILANGGTVPRTMDLLE